MHYRKRYVIHKRFQFDFTMKILAVVFAPVLLCTLFFLFYLQMKGWMTGMASGSLINLGFIFSFLLRALPVAFVILIFSIFFSHRIAGPVNRMQKACEHLAGGQPVSRITLRKKDYFHEFATKLNLLNDPAKTIGSTL